MDAEVQKNLVDRGLEKYKSKMVGAVLRPQQGNEVATKDAIRHFANGTGDLNPLWLNEDYAKKSMYGTILAPPFFLNAISEGQAIVGLPGLISTFVGAEWEWHHVIRKNDAFTVTNTLLDLEEKGGKEGQRRFLQSGILRYLNQRDDVTGTCKWNMMRTEAKLGGQKRGKKKGKSSEPEIHFYTKEELSAIYKTLDREEVRGDKPRYWEDVNVNDELVPVVKGPLSLSDMIAWAIGTGWHRIALAHGAKLSFLRKKPGLSYQDPDTGAPEPIANSHFLGSAARILMGSPLPLDLGFQRISWLGHLITNWMSDYGFLKKLSARLKNFVRFGDTNWCKGEVVKKWKQGEEHLVELELFCKNQRDEITMTGAGVVVLPSKGE